jgi:hypothetical protein
MSRILLPASFLAIALPASHSILMTDTGIRFARMQRTAIYHTPLYQKDPVLIAEPLANDDPAWYNNYE